MNTRSARPVLIKIDDHVVYKGDKYRVLTTNNAPVQTVSLQLLFNPEVYITIPAQDVQLLKKRMSERITETVRRATGRFKRLSPPDQ